MKYNSKSKLCVIHIGQWRSGTAGRGAKKSRNNGWRRKSAFHMGGGGTNDVSILIESRPAHSIVTVLTVTQNGPIVFLIDRAVQKRFRVLGREVLRSLWYRGPPCGARAALPICTALALFIDMNCKSIVSFNTSLQASIKNFE